MLRNLGIFLGLVTVCHTNYPIFDIQTQMRQLLIPADAAIGSIIYRLRASDADRDYPLNFDATDYGSYVVKIESLPCTKNDDYCMANVYLERTLIPGQLFKFRMTVRDTRGDTTTIPVAIHVTDGITETDLIFPHIPGVIMIPEDTTVGNEVEYVIARKNPRLNRPVYLELWGPSNFDIEQTSKMDVTRGAIKVVKPLDYEEKTMYTLTIYAIDMYTDNEIDTRNIAGFQVVVIVSDVQDTPPVWDQIEPLTKLPQNITEGDIVLAVSAVDGDRGSPRAIKYGLVSEGNPFTVFFDIDQKLGTIRLVRPLKELISISRSHQPILLTVIAEEEVKDRNGPPPMSSTATVALLLSEVANSPPYFHNQNYVCRIDENSLQGTALVFGDPYITEVRDDDMGKQGIFSLSLENNNGTFEVTPTVAERSANFVIRVRDNSLLDYEKRHTVTVIIVATEVSPGNPGLSSTANILVYIDDVNDNDPVFVQSQYNAQLPENATMGTKVVTVEATDLDTGQCGVIKFTRIMGYKNNSLSLHPDSGVITIATDNHGLDREEASEYRFFVEARDNDGTGNSAKTLLILQILDINDETPIFVRNPNDFILSSDRSNFSQKAFVQAVDKDAESPNNVVRYEIISGNYGNSFYLNPETGELTVSELQYNRKRQANEKLDTSVMVLMVRAYDLGVPTRWSVAEVRIFPPENGARIMTFIVPGRNPDRKALQEMLSVLTAGRVSIQSVQPYFAGVPVEGNTRDLAPGYPDTDKSVVVATVMYNRNTIIDLEQLENRLLKNKTSHIVSASVGNPQYENQILFYILILILILIALAILTLLICCLCSGCPLYAAFYRKRRRVHSPEESYSRSGHESKGVQAEPMGFKEAWSGDAAHRDQWQFSRRNEQSQRVVLVGKGQPEYVRIPRDTVVLPREHIRQGPNVIYTREISDRHDGHPVFVEDIDGAEYRVLDPSRLARGHQDDDTDSIRRHEYERGSDVGRVEGRIKASARESADDMPRSRDQMFIRDGNAEILRLVTRGRIEEEDGPGLNQPDRPFTVVHDAKDKHEDEGKDIIMKRFMEDQHRGDDNIQRADDRVDQEKKDHKETDEDTRDSDLIKRLMEYKPDVETLSQDVNRLTVLQRDLLLTRFLVEEQRRFLGHPSSSVDETQSLPGVMMSMGTQTDRDRGTQTEDGFYTMRPPRRNAKSDNDESISDSELEEQKRAEKRKKSFYRNGRRLRYIHRRQNTENFDEILKRGEKRCEIKTPILEETESAVEAASAVAAAAAAVVKDEKPKFAATKSSLLRKQSTRIKLYMLKTAGGNAVEEGTIPGSSETYNVIVNKDSSTDDNERNNWNESQNYNQADRRDGRHHLSFQSTSQTVDAVTNLAHGSHRQQLQSGGPNQYSHQNFPNMHSTAQAVGSLKGFVDMKRSATPVQNISQRQHSHAFQSATHTLGNTAQAIESLKGFVDKQRSPPPDAQIMDQRQHAFQSVTHTLGNTAQAIESLKGFVDMQRRSPTVDEQNADQRRYSQSFQSATHTLGNTAQAIESLKGFVDRQRSPTPDAQNVDHRIHSQSFQSTSHAIGSVMGLAGDHAQSHHAAIEQGIHSPSLYQASQAVGAVFGFSGEVQMTEPHRSHSPNFHRTSQLVGSVITGVIPEHESENFQNEAGDPQEQSEHVVPTGDSESANKGDFTESGRDTAKSAQSSSSSVKSMMGALKGFARFGKTRKARLKSSSESQLLSLTATNQTLEAAKLLGGKAKAKSLQSTPVAKKKRFSGIATLSRLLTPSKPQPHSCIDTSAKSKGSQDSLKSKTSMEKINLNKKPKKDPIQIANSGKKIFDKNESDKAKLIKTIEILQKPKKTEKKYPRYMEWFKKRKDEKEQKKAEEKIEKDKTKEKEKELKMAKSLKKPEIMKRKVEDDLDSGIAMSLMMPPSQNLRRRNQNLLEKKSVFTIAYDEMHTRTLSTDNTTPP